MSALPKQPTAGKSSSVETAVWQIRQFIQQTGMKLGDVLPTENALAQRLNLSRSTVREAIRTLKAYGVVESKKKVGAMLIDRRHEAMLEMFSFTFDLSPKTFQDVQDFRRLVEINLAEQLLQAADWSWLANAQRLNEDLRKADSASVAARLDYAFHCTLVDAAGNRTVSELYRLMQPVICRLTELGKQQRSNLEETADEHQGILEAIERRDRIALAYLYHRHLQSGIRFLARQNLDSP